MAELVVHIGTPKTGTTRMQRSWFRSQPTLAAAGWYLPTYAAGMNHIRIAFAFSDEPRSANGQFPELASTEGRLAERALLAKELDERVTPDSHWLITAEDFAHRIHTPAEVAAIREFFQKWFDRIRVVVYLRRHDHYAMSFYSQIIRTRDSASLHHFDVESLQSPLYFGGTLNPVRTLSVWQEAFEPANVIALPYLESFSKSGDRQLAEFHEVAGIPVAPGDLRKVKFTNRGLSQDAMLFVLATAEQRDRVINDPTVPQQDPSLEAIARSLRPYWKPGQPVQDTINEYHRNLVDLTPGPKLAITPDVAHYLSGLCDRDGVILAELAGRSPAWDEWCAAPGLPVTDVPPAISDERIAEILTQLANGSHSLDTQAPPARTDSATRARRKIFSRRSK